MNFASSDEDESMEEEKEEDQLETQAESNPVAQDVNVVELGHEKTNEQLLNKYLILHCAKLHLTVTDASSGDYVPNLKKRMGSQSYGGEFLRMGQ